MKWQRYGSGRGLFQRTTKACANHENRLLQNLRLRTKCIHVSKYRNRHPTMQSTHKVHKTNTQLAGSVRPHNLRNYQPYFHEMGLLGCILKVFKQFFFVFLSPLIPCGFSYKMKFCPLCLRRIKSVIVCINTNAFVIKGSS